MASVSTLVLWSGLTPHPLNALFNFYIKLISLRHPPCLRYPLSYSLFFPSSRKRTPSRYRPSTLLFSSPTARGPSAASPSCPRLMFPWALCLLLSSLFLPLESFQLQMGFSFPFLRANDLRSSLLNIRARSFLLSYT